MPGGREEDFLKKYINLTLFNPKITSPLDGGHEIYNLQFLISLPYRCYIPNLVRIGPVVAEEKMLTHDGRQPIAIGHLSDSGDLKKQYKWKPEDRRYVYKP